MVVSAPDHTVVLPGRLTRLAELAENLWWTWQPAAKAIFRDLDPRLWEETDENPVLLLGRIAPERLAAAAADPDYVAAYQAVIARFDAMLTAAPETTWVGHHEPELVDRAVAYFSAEFGLHQDAADLLRRPRRPRRRPHQGRRRPRPAPRSASPSSTARATSASASPPTAGSSTSRPTSPPGPNRPPRSSAPTAPRCLVAVAFDQPDAAGPARHLAGPGRPGAPSTCSTPTSRATPTGRARSPPASTAATRSTASARRSSSASAASAPCGRWAMRPDYWHANEGHAAFHLLERARELVAAGQTFAEAAEQVRATTVFTSHTPVPAGHDVFPPHLMDRYFAHYWPELGLTREEFLALGHHERQRRRLQPDRPLPAPGRPPQRRQRAPWRDHPLDVARPLARASRRRRCRSPRSPTASTCRPGSPPGSQRLLDRYLPADWRERQDEPAIWEPIARHPGRGILGRPPRRQARPARLPARAHAAAAGRPASSTPVRSSPPAPSSTPDILTVGFARRFAIYKRATLLFHDAERLAAILTNPERPVQIIFAGKAHPADDGGKRLIQEIFWRAREPRFQGRIAFVEDYDMGVAARLVAGVDVWLNNPRAPLEASGTSGMKAGANGVANLSILDGWWLEGWEPESANGWGIPPAPLDDAGQDAAEADAIYDLLERSVVPRYYDRDERGLPLAWIAMAKRAITTVAPAFSAQRMVIDYIRRLYLPAARGDHAE